MLASAAHTLKIGTIQRRLAQPLPKVDKQIPEVFHIFNQRNALQQLSSNLKKHNSKQQTRICLALWQREEERKNKSLVSTVIFFLSEFRTWEYIWSFSSLNSERASAFAVYKVPKWADRVDVLRHMKTNMSSEPKPSPESTANIISVSIFYL